MEVAITVEIKSMESMKFTWTIDKFTKLNTKKLYSKIFVVDGYKWRIFIYPKGNNVDHLSMYLGVADTATLPSGWSKDAQISFSVVNQINNKSSIRNDTQHLFKAKESDWGFTSFMPLSDLTDPSRGYLVNDTVVIEAEVNCLYYNKAQAHFYTIIKVARDEDLVQQIGSDRYFDLVDHDKVRSFRIQKHTPFSLFKEEVAKEFGIPVECQRFWIWAKRQNLTYRPHRPLTAQEEAQSIEQLRKVSSKKHNTELKLFLEVEFGLDLYPIRPPEISIEDFLLFFKLYDPEKGEIRYVGRLFVKSSDKLIEILAKLNQMAGFAVDEEIELYEEVKFEPCVMCEHLDKGLTFQASQIVDGDIICFQKAPPLECEEECEYPDVPSFLKYVHNRQPTDIEDIGTISLDDVDTFFHSLSSDMPSSSALSTSQVSKLSKEEIEEALKQIKEALQMPPVQFDYPGRIPTIEKALQTLSHLDESSGITIGQNAYLLSLTEKFKILPARASKAIKAKDNLAQKETLKTTLDQNLESYIAHFTVKKAETVQAEEEIQELKAKQKAAEKKKKTLATEIKELYKRSLLDKKQLDRLKMEMPKYEEEAKAGEEEEKTVNEEWKNMMDLISNISANLKY